MNLHPAEIAAQIAQGADAALILDQAGWRLSGRLALRDDIAIAPPPSKRHELDPRENIWRFMRDNWLSNRIFRSYEDILDHGCYAWNKLIDQL